MIHNKAISATWVKKGRDSWRRACSDLGLPDVSLRKPIPRQDDDDKPCELYHGVSTRCLEHPSASVVAVLTVLSVWYRRRNRGFVSEHPRALVEDIIKYLIVSPRSLRSRCGHPRAQDAFASGSFRCSRAIVRGAHRGRGRRCVRYSVDGRNHGRRQDACSGMSTSVAIRSPDSVG